jgi:hypothetical protein
MNQQITQVSTDELINNDVMGVDLFVHHTKCVKIFGSALLLLAAH